MANYIEQYRAKQGGVTLHTWTEVQGGEKRELLYYRGSRNASSLVVPRCAAADAAGGYRRLSVEPFGFL